MSFPLTVYKASAGSGKTFTLTTEYIKLLVKHPQSYRSILAVTFTNKATEEMKMRIISQLYGIWKQLPDSKSYIDVVCSDLDMSPELVSRQAGLALMQLIHHYNDFHVETIDSFFQSVLRNLARELDLSANLNVSLNDEQIEEMAVDQLIDGLEHSDKMLQWLLGYIMDTISDDKSWNVIGQIKHFGKHIFKDYYKDVSAELTRKMDEPNFFEKYLRQLKVIKQQSVEQMRRFSEIFFKTLEENGLQPSDLAQGTRGVAGMFAKIGSGKFDESIVNSYVKACLDGPEGWYSKNSSNKEAIHALVLDSLDRLLRDTLEARPRAWKAFKSAEATLRHINQVRLLGSIEQKVHQLNEEASRFLLSDTQQMLQTLIGQSDAPFIFEKIGTQLEHVMIDEFQDTSTVQWQNFKVLLKECMSRTETHNLIVGDVKQSIYRWRSGDWRLLNDIEKQFPGQSSMLHITGLDTNYRSQRNIINFNNLFFKVAAQWEYEGLVTDGCVEADQLRRAYADVEQRVPQHRGETGMVDVKLLPKEDYTENTLSEMASIVENLCEQGVATNNIAILVRTNKNIPLIANYFMEHLPSVNLVSDEAFRLDASQAVNLLINALRLIENQNDRLSRAALVVLYQRLVCGCDCPDIELLKRASENDDADCLDKWLPSTFVQEMDSFQMMPLYNLVERLCSLFSISRLSGQSAYVCTFFDELGNFVSDHPASISGFLAEWDATIHRQTIQSDELEGIRILSIHKSKGLEFDNVIVPFCDWALEKTHGNIVWCVPGESPFSELPIAPVDYSAANMMGTIYEQDYLREHLQNCVDNLNLLYVAFTRASHNLFVIGRHEVKSKTASSLRSRNTRAVLLQECLPMIKEQLNGATLTGTDDEKAVIEFHFGDMYLPDTVKTERLSQNVFLQPSYNEQISTESFEGRVTFRQSNQSHEFVSDDDEPDSRKSYIKMGNVLHYVFSKIHTINDVENALEQLRFDGVLYDENVSSERLRSLIRKRLGNPRVAEWFSGQWQLFNECTILGLDETERQLKIRRPDRVMTNGRRMIVVDFKFGVPRKEYHQQVEEYMRLLKDMGYSDVEGYLWYVYTDKIEKV